MIETLFPKTVSNILDYDAVKLAAQQYVEATYVQIVTSFANNLVLQYMDAEHLEEVSLHVTGDKNTTLQELLDYINAENIYRECDFVSDLTSEFPEGVIYELHEVTGWKFPDSDISPFNLQQRSYNPDGSPRADNDSVWKDNAEANEPEKNLLLSRFCRQFDFDLDDFDWHRREGRRASWGNTETWMTTGGFGKPGTIHINVDEEHSVIEENGLTTVENWLGTVSHKLPINLYIEIISNFTTNAEPASSSLTGYHMAFPYEEEEGFCTNDPDWPNEVYYEPGPEPPPPPPPPAPEPEYSFIVVNESTGEIVHSITSSQMIIVITPSVAIQSFYFTANGAAETEDTPLETGTYLVYDAFGNTVDNETTIYNSSLAVYFTEESGNMTVADGEFLEFVDGHLRLNMNGNTRSAWSVQVRKLQVQLLGTINSDSDIFTDMSYLPFGTIVMDS